MFGSDSSDGGGDLDRDMYHHHQQQHRHHHQQQQQRRNPRETRLFSGGGSAAGSDMSGLGADLAGILMCHFV